MDFGINQSMWLGEEKLLPWSLRSVVHYSVFLFLRWKLEGAHATVWLWCLSWFQFQTDLISLAELLSKDMSKNVALIQIIQLFSLTFTCNHFFSWLSRCVWFQICKRCQKTTSSSTGGCNERQKPLFIWWTLISCCRVNHWQATSRLPL